MGAIRAPGGGGEAGLGALRQDFKSGLRFIYLFSFKGPEHLLKASQFSRLLAGGVTFLLQPLLGEGRGHMWVEVE